jgi:hypothetical protein
MKELEKYGVIENEEHLILLKPLGRLLKINKKYYIKNNSYFLLKNEDTIKNKIEDNLRKVSNEDYLLYFTIYINNIINNKHFIQLEEIESLLKNLKNKELIDLKTLLYKNIFNIKLKYECFTTINKFFDIDIETINKNKLEKSIFFKNLNLDEKRKFLKEDVKMDEKNINNYIENIYLSS